MVVTIAEHVGLAAPPAAPGEWVEDGELEKMWTRSSDGVCVRVLICLAQGSVMLMPCCVYDVAMTAVVSPHVFTRAWRHGYYMVVQSKRRVSYDE